MKKIVLIFCFSIFFLSCGDDDCKFPLFSEKLEPKMAIIEKDEQFIIDKLELIYFSKNRLNENVSELISKLSESDYKELLSYLLGIKSFSDFGFSEISNLDKKSDSSDDLDAVDLDADSNSSENTQKVIGSKLTPSKKTWNLLYSYHDDYKVQKLISYIFSSIKNSFSQQAFFLLYSLNYKFSENELNRFSEISPILKKWIKFYNNKEGFKEISGEISLENENLSDLVENLILKGDDSQVKNLTDLKKEIVKFLKEGKKEIVKLSKKKKDEEAQQKVDELNKKVDLYNSFLPSISNYLYFFSNEKKLVENRGYVEFFYLNQTPIKTAKQFYTLFSEVKKSSYPIQLLYIDYIFKKSEYKIQKKDSDFLTKLLKNRKYPFLQYSFLKKYFSDQFSKLSLKDYQKKLFFKPLLGLEHIQNLKEDPYQLDTLEKFILDPSQVAPLIPTLFDAYTTKIGKESFLYMLLKIVLKGGLTLPENAINSIDKVKIVYFQEIAKYFK